MQSNAEKAQCKFCREIRTQRSDLSSHDASNKHQRTAVPHYTIRQNGDQLKSSDSNDEMFDFAFVNR